MNKIIAQIFLIATIGTILFSGACMADPYGHGYKPSPGATSIKADDIISGDDSVDLTTSTGDVTIGSDSGSVDIETSSSINLKPSSDTDDYITLTTTGDQTLINFTGCEGSIESDSGVTRLEGNVTIRDYGAVYVSPSVTSGICKQSNGGVSLQATQSSASNIYFYAGNDSDDYLRLSTNSNQMKMEFMGCEGVISSNQSKITLTDPVNLASSTDLNALTASVTGVTAYATGLEVNLITTQDSTGAVTLNINSLGAKKVYLSDNSTQADSGDISANQLYKLLYNANLDSGTGGFAMVSGSSIESITLIMSAAEICANMVDNNGYGGRLDIAGTGAARAYGSSSAAYAIALPIALDVAGTSQSIKQITVYLSTVDSGDYVAISVKSLNYTDGTYATEVVANNVGNLSTGWTSATLLSSSLSLSSNKAYYLYCDSTVTDADADILYGAIKIEFE